MNKIYRLVWNRETGTMVVASEFAKSDSSGVVITRRQGRARVALLAMAVMMALPAGNVWAADYVCVDPATGQPMPSSSVPGTGSEVACGQGAVAAGKDSIAIGTGATTSAAAESAIAIGTGAKVTQRNSFAFGSRAEATGSNSLAVGNAAIASAQSTAAFGDGAQATGAQSTAVGVATRAQSTGASAFGHASEARGDHDLAAGSSAIASGGASIAMGSGAQSAGAQAIAMGQNARASGRFDIAIGRNAMNGATVAGSSSNIGIGDGALRNAVNSDNNSAIGSSAGNKLTGQHNVMFGAYANSTTAVNDYERWLIDNHPGQPGTPATPTGNGVTANSTVALGGRALAYALNSVAVGNRAWAIGASSIALGMSSKALGRYSIAQGYAAEAGGVSSIAIGAAQNATNKTQATKNYAIAIGSINTLAAGESSIAFGHLTQATHDKAIALGKQTEAQAIGAVAMGGWGNPAELLGNRATISKAPYSVVLGTAAQANEFSDSTVVIGNQAEAKGASINSTAKDSVAIGYRSLVTTASNIAIGSSAKADDKSQATAIGNNANAKGYQSIALGSNSFADSNAGSGLALGREAQVTTGNAVALGSLARADRVARADGAGTDAAATLANGKVYANADASQTAKDAVSATVQRDENAPTTVALGAVSVGYDYIDTTSGKRRHATRQITHVAAGTADSDAVNVAQLKAVAEVAEKPLAFAGDTGANVTRKLGETVKVTGGRDDEADLSELNIGVVANGSDTLEIKLAKDLIGLSSAQFQDADGNITTVDGDGISIEPADPAKGVVSLTSAGLDNGGNRITNVAAGVNDNDAVNVAQFNAARTRFYSVNSTDTTAGNYNNDGATGTNALAAGVNALAEQHESVAVGKGARTTGTESGSVAIGADATANGALGVAIGAGATASGDSSGGPIGSPGGIAIGSAASAKNGGMAIGSGAYSGNGTALLPGLPTLLNNNVALGDSARVKDDTNFRVALGTMSIAGEADLTAAPYTPMTGATIAGIAAPGVTLGEVSVGGDNRTFPGDILYRRITNVAAGAADTDAVNVSQLKALANAPLAFSGDTGTDVSRKLGETVNIVGGVGSESLLTDANIGVVGDGTDTLEIKLAKDLVGLESAHFDDGSGNETEINGKGLTIANADPSKVVSLTSAGLNNGGNQITNVAAGELSATSTDAVNGSQLFATNQNVAANTAAINTLNTTVVKPITFAGDTGTDVSRKLGETVNIVGGVGSESLLTDANIGVVGDGTDTLEIKLAKDLVGLESASFDDGSGNETEINGKGLTIANADPTKVVSLTSAGLNNGGNKITNVAAGVDDNDAVNFSQLKAVQTLVNAGWTVADSAGNKANIGPSGVVTFSSADSNIKVAQTGADQAGKVEITLNRNLDLDSVTAGGNRLDAKGLTIAGGPTISATGIDMGGKKISNLAAGTEEGDAVNLGQLKNHVREETAKVKTHYYSVNDGGTKGGNYDNNGATANGAIAAGVDTTATAMNAVAMGKGAAASHAGSVALGADAQTQAVDNTGTFMLNGGTAAGVNAVAVVSVGSKGNERRIVNVAAGRLSAGSTDAVNGSQLFAVGTAVNNLGNATALALGGNTTYTPGGGLSVSLKVGGNTYTNVQDALNAVSGGGTGATKVVAGTNTQVTRNGDTYTVSVVDKPVVDGKATFNGGIEVAGGQSVNMGGNVVRNVAAGVADTDAVNVGQLNGAIAGANAYTDGRFNQLANDMWQIDRGYRGATASAMAMAGLPQAYLPGKSMFSAAVGGYRGEYGLAFGLSGITDNGKWVYKAQASGNTARDWGFSAGVGVQW